MDSNLEEDIEYVDASSEIFEEMNETTTDIHVATNTNSEEKETEETPAVVEYPYTGNSDEEEEEEEYDELALYQHSFEGDLTRSISDLIRDRHQAFMNYVFTVNRQPNNQGEEEEVLAAASTHSYLPVSMPEEGTSTATEVSRRRLEMPILPLSGVVLFPGESLPMRVFSAAHLTILEELTATSQSESESESKAYIGVLNKSHGNSSDWNKVGVVGTVCEVMASTRQGGGFGGGDDTGHPELVLVCKGVKRFELTAQPVMKRGCI